MINIVMNRYDNLLDGPLSEEIMKSVMVLNQLTTYSDSFFLSLKTAMLPLLMS